MFRFAMTLTTLVWWLSPLVRAQETVQAADDVLKAERALAAAMHARDAQEMDRLLAPEYVLRGAPDMDRAAWIRNTLAQCWGDRSDIAEYRARTYGDVVIASFLLTFHVDPSSCVPTTRRSLVTDLWSRGPGGWRLVVRHAAPDPSAAAQKPAVPEVLSTWDVRGELSAVATAGNASTRTVGLGAELVRTSARRTTRAVVAFVRSEAEDVLNAQSLTTEARHGLRVRDNVEVFARIGYARDRFAGIENRETAEIGASYQATLPSRHALTAEAGVGVTLEERSAVRDLRFTTATASIVYGWTPAAGTELSNDFLLTADLHTARNWRATNALALSVALTRMFSLKASQRVEYRNLPVPGFRRADMRTSIALVVALQRRRVASP